MVRLGLFIYALALFTSFMHVWEVYSRFGGHFPALDRVWVALGVALGLDLTALYYSYLSVQGIKSARLGSYMAVSLVWFAVLVSLMTGAQTLLERAVAFILSSFVLVTTFFLGRVLGELSQRSKPEEEVALAYEVALRSQEPSEPLYKDDLQELVLETEWVTTREAASRLGMAKSSFLAWAKRKRLPHKQEGRALLWDWKEVYAAVQSGDERKPAASPAAD